MASVTHQQALGIAMEHQRFGRIAEAEAICRQLLAIYPQNADLRNFLGVLSHQAGRPDEGCRLLEQAIAANPNDFSYHNNFGLVLTDLHRFDEAVAEFHTAIRLQPDSAESFYNLGIALGKMGRSTDAVAAYRNALRIRPDHAMARLNLGSALASAGHIGEAIAHYHSVLNAEPGNDAVAINLAGLLKDAGRPGEAIEIYRMVLQRAPDHAIAMSNLSVTLKDTGEIDEAIALLRRAVALDPKNHVAHSNLIFTLYSDPGVSAEVLAHEHRLWQQRHAEPLRQEWRPHPNDRDPARRLRIGYVSPDLREHVVGRTLLPCFEAHDRSQFEIICYSETAVTDAVGERFRRGSAVWREVANLSDAELAAQIRADRIDILVDLALHTAFNRLRVFALKPAPVQITWLGYPGATGLEAMDWRITDPHLDPPGVENADAFEKPLRLPDCWCSYGAPEDSPEPGALPAMQSGRVTFGSFNNLSKINDRVLTLWAGILRSVENSRLLLLSKGGSTERIANFFMQNGVAPERVEFLRYQPAAEIGTGPARRPNFLDRYRQVDIALDPFPYNGMTTTLDALWMGVPVIALAGTMPMGRAALSLLANAGLPDLAAQSPDEYARTAAALAADLPRLASLRAGLRGKMQTSPLLDAPRFARNLEASFRAVWTRWCALPPGPATA
jgi:predicted O-linked N-acetylglucosamine transferase (SPINDLY family)